MALGGENAIKLQQFLEGACLGDNAHAFIGWRGERNRPLRPQRQRTSQKMKAQRLVFLLDVDNTLLDTDRVTADLGRYLEREIGEACRQRYWAILEDLRAELGYADYLGA